MIKNKENIKIGKINKKEGGDEINIDNDVLIRLYIMFQQGKQGWLNLHRQHFTQFATIILAFLTASLGIFYHFDSQLKYWEKLTLASLPSLNVILSIVGIKVCDRFYRRFLESTTIADKLYFLLKNKVGDIDSIIKNNKNIFPGNSFQNDSYLFPNRWINEIKKCKKSDKFNPKNRKEPKGFVEKKISRGSNFWIRLTFYILIFINLLVGAFIFTFQCVS
jgi:hypothetical protein